MNKLAKRIAVLLSVLIITTLSTVMLISAFSEDSATYTLYLKEETDTSVTLGVKLHSGAFNSVDMEVGATGVNIDKCTYSDISDTFYEHIKSIKRIGGVCSSASNNKDNKSKLSFACTLAIDILDTGIFEFTFSKNTPEKICRDDFYLTISACSIVKDGSRENIETKVINELPESTTEIATEPWTEPPTEAPTEAPTEPWTEPTTNPYYYNYGYLSFDIRNNKAYVSGCSKNAKGVIEIPSEVEGYSVVGIDAWVFNRRNKITEIVFPASIKNVGRYAFQDCSALEKINLTNVTAVSYCAFSNCSNLKTINFGNNPDLQLDYDMFYGCSSLERLIVGKNVKNYCSDSFGVLYNKDKTGLIQYPVGSNYSSYTVDSNAAYINEEAFRNADNLKSVIIPKDIISIGAYAFDDCDGLTSIYIPEGAFTICYSAFSNCRNVKSITIPESVTTIGAYAFSNCLSLERVYYNAKEINTDGARQDIFYDSGDETNGIEFILGETVNSIPSWLCQNSKTKEVNVACGADTIEEYAFAECPTLIDVIINGNERINVGGDIFLRSNNAHICCKENSFMHFYADSHGLKIKIFNDNNDVFEVKNDVLINYTGDSDSVFCQSASRIGFQSFAKNTKLKSVEISSRVNRIYDKAFEDCSNLEKIIIPKSVASIGDDAFVGCNKLTIWCYAGSYAEQFALIHNISIHYITMEISNTVVELNTFDVCQLTAALNVDLVEEELHWTSDNPDVVTVSPDGKLTAVGVGKATITATSSSGLSVKCIVTVYDNTVEDNNVKSVSIDDIQTNYNRTVSLDLKVETVGNPEYTVEYISSNTDVATVDSNGNVKTTGKGNATITVMVTDSNGNVVKDTCNVNVKFTFAQWLLYIICFGWVWM